MRLRQGGSGKCDKTTLEGNVHGFGACSNAEFGIHMANVAIHRTDAKIERLGDFFVGTALAEEVQNLKLAGT